MADFTYKPMFRMGEDKTEYKLLSKDGVSTAKFEGRDVLKVEAEALSELARQGFSDINYLFRTEHLQSLRNIIEDPEASDNDRYSLERRSPGCISVQDTPIKTIHNKRKKTGIRCVIFFMRPSDSNIGIMLPAPRAFDNNFRSINVLPATPAGHSVLSRRSRRRRRKFQNPSE